MYYICSDLAKSNMKMQAMNQEDILREKGIYRVTIVGSIVNFLLLVFKFFAGIAGHSAAMLADAVHSLSDFVTDIIVIVFVRISAKPEDENHDYGHGKYETLATAIIGIFLLFVGFGIFWNGASSIYRFLRGGSLQEPGMLALVAALVSIVFKEALYQYTVFKGKKLNSQAVIANAWHHRSDALSSIGTAIGIGGAILLGSHWRVLDPAAAVIVSFFIMKVAVQLLIPCVDELLEKSLPAEMENRMKETILSFPGVSSPHNLRTRRIGSYCAIEVHVRMDGKISLEEAHRTATAIEDKLREQFGRSTLVSIHVEPTK
jgi:cation diffusion facilitator family transporter